MHWLQKLFFAGLVFCNTALFCADSAAQTLNITIGIINELSLSSSTVSLSTDDGDYVNGTIEVVNTSASLDVTTNESGKKFIGSLNEDMPTGVQLFLRITGGTSTGTGNLQSSYQELTSSTVDLITGMDDFTLDDGTLDFKLVANENANPITQSYTLTLSISDS